MFKPKSKSPEEKDKDRRNALIGAVGLAAVGTAATHEPLPDLDASSNMRAMNSAASAEAPENNPTLGKHSSDAPEAVVIPAPQPEAADSAVVDLGEENVVIHLAEEQHVVENPER